MYNKVIMVGRLTKDIELRYLPSGAALAKSTIASSHSYKTQSGEKKEEACFLDFNMFNRSAEIANQYLRKGSKVLLEGRLVLEQWTAQDGTNRSKHSLRVDNMTMLDSKADSAALAQQGGNQGYNAPSAPAPQQQNQYNAPSNNYGQQQQGGNSYGQQQAQAPVQRIPEINIDEDEIPF